MTISYFSGFLKHPMNKVPLIVFLFTFFHLTAMAQTTIPEQGIMDKKSVYTLLKNATVHSSPGQAQIKYILIHKNTIVAIGDSSEIIIPENTVLKDYSGFHIYPSFIELNSSYGVESGKIVSNENRAVYWNSAIHPELNAVDVFSPDDKVSKALREMGFGYTVSQIKNGIARGTSVLTQTADGEALENVLKSQVGMNFSFQSGKSKSTYPKSLMGSVALLRQAYYDALWYEKSTDHEVNFSLEALVGSSGLPSFFEIQEKYDIPRLGRIAKEFDKEYIVLGSGDSYQLYKTDFDGVKAIVAPLNFPTPFDMSDPDLSRFVSQADLLHWERAPFNPFYIQQLNIPLVLSANGISKPKNFFENLLLCINKGLDRDSAFAALTTTPARILEMDDKIGKLEKGYLANFFISDSEIFSESGAELIAHYINGEYYSIKNTDSHKLEGDYTLNVNDVYFDLLVKGDEKWKAKVLYISGKDTTEMKASISLQSNEVSLAFVNDKKGTYRLAGTIISDNRIWNGNGYDPEGNYVSWNAIRRKAKKTNPSRDSIPVTDSIPLPPAYHFPLTAYGFDSIPKAQNLLIKNATIWTSDSLGVIENGSIMIAFGKIVAVGKTINPGEFLGKKNQSDYSVIDARGKHITAGIIDEHSHIAISRGVNEGTQASTAEVRISDALNPGDINIYRQLGGGVTTSQLLHGSANPIGGQSALIKLRWGKSYEEMLFENAPQFIKFALGENVKQSNWGSKYTNRYPQTRMGVEQFFYEYLYRAKEYGQLKEIASARKTDKKGRNKKNEPELKPFRTDLEMDAILEVLNGDRNITCHSYVQSEINMLMHVADSMGFKVNTFTHILEGYKVADKMRIHGAAGSTFSDWWAYKYEVKDAIPYNAALMTEAGVLTAINSDDAEMARRLNQEAAKSVKYGGMSEEEALKMVTINPAIMLHIDHRVGSITPGKDADFVIWSGNPLSVYSKAEQTFIDGVKYFDRTEMEKYQQRDQKERIRIAELMEDAKAKGSEAKKPQRKVERYYHCDTED